MGTLAPAQGTFPPKTSPVTYEDNDAIAGFRFEFQLSQPANNNPWQITVASGGRSLTVDNASMAATDGTFLSPLLDPAAITVTVPLGAPTLSVKRKILNRNFGRALSYYKDSNDQQPFFAVSEKIAEGGPAAPRLQRAARAMVWLGIEDSVANTFDSCTGFLIADDLVLTARHCLSTDSQQSNLVVSTSKVVRAWMREITPTRELAPTFDRVEIVWPDRQQASPASIDAVILQLSKPVSSGFPVKLATTPVGKDQELQIIEFPGIRELSLPGNSGCKVFQIYTTAPHIAHHCNTEAGSSGSPVFDRNLQSGVVALHIRGWVDDPSEENKALRISAVLDTVKSENQPLYEKITKQQEKLSW